MDCTFYWNCYRRIDGTRQRIFFIGQLTVIYGFVATCIVLPIVFKRLKAFPLQTSIKPNTSTICAPFSLVAAAYVIAFPKANTFIVIILLLLAQIFYFYIIIQLPKLLKNLFASIFSFHIPFSNLCNCFKEQFACTYVSSHLERSFVYRNVISHCNST